MTSIPNLALIGSIGLVFGGQTDPQTRYLDLVRATLANPVRTEELRRWALSSGGVQVVRELFERTIDERLDVDGHVITPELGGEAMIIDERGRARELSPH